MPQLDKYLEALLPTPITVLGLTLKPFSLGTLNILQRSNCLTFVNGFKSTPESIAKYVNDFLVTIVVCSMTYEEAKQADETNTITICKRVYKKDGTFTEVFSKASFSEYIAKWNKQVEKACKKNTVNMLQEMAKVQQYIKDAFAGPDSYPLEDKNNSGFKSGASWEQSLREYLLLKYSESEAMNLPLSLAFWEWTKEAEKNRQVGIKSDQDVNAIDILKAMKV